MRLHNSITKIILPAACLSIFLIGHIAYAANCCLVNQDGTPIAQAIKDNAECTKLGGSFTTSTFVPNASPSEDKTECIKSSSGLDESTPTISNPLDNPQLSVKIPGLTLSDSTCDADGCSTPWLADYIQGLYQYGIGAIALLAVISLMIGGLLWTTSAGNQERVGDAKKWIGGSLMGVLISLTAYTVLNIINPALINLSPIKVRYIAQEDLGPYEDLSNPPGISTSTAQCAAGVSGIDNLVTSFIKSPNKFVWSENNRGTCANGTCICDCSQFAQDFGKCAGFKPAAGEGTSATLLNNPNKKRITTDICNGNILAPGDIIVMRTWCKKGNAPRYRCGHVMTYLGNDKVIECGGGSEVALDKRNGAVKLSYFKAKCNQYLLTGERESYYIKR